MKMKVADNIYFYRGRGEDKLIRGAGSCNVIIATGGQQAMVDTGLIVAGSFADLEKKAAADGVNLRDTYAILHTHAHWDHITGDCIVQKKYGAKVYAHSREKPIIESQEVGFQAMLLDTGHFYREIFGLPPIFYRLLLRYLGGSYEGLHVDCELKGGERLAFGADVCAVHTPGHCPGHLGFHFPATRVFAGGDLIDLESGTCADLNNPYSNYADALASLEKVRDMDIEIFLPSHGEAVQGKERVQALLDAMIANTHRFMNDIRDFLSHREGTLADIFKYVMPDVPFTLKAMKMMQVLACLKHLHKEQQVILEKQGNKLVWRLIR
jgi:glyoxylase-like metal-dependent hydrolase (beta-lactamase superfamily II)